MTRILLTPLVQDALTRELVPGRLTAIPYFGTVVEGPKVTFGQLLTWNFDGYGVPTIDIAEPGMNQAWVMTLTVRATKIVRTVSFSGTSVDWEHLTDVDPDTLVPLPVNEQLAAWNATKNDIQTALATALDVPDLSALLELPTIAAALDFPDFTTFFENGTL